MIEPIDSPETNAQPDANGVEPPAARANGSDLHGSQGELIVPIGKVPDCHRQIAPKIRTFRDVLQKAIIQSKGSLIAKDLFVAATAVRYERAAMLMEATIEEHYDDMSFAERRQYVQAIAGMSADRDKSIEKLKLEGDGDDFDQLYKQWQAEEHGELRVES